MVLLKLIFLLGMLLLNFAFASFTDEYLNNDYSYQGCRNNKNSKLVAYFKSKASNDSLSNYKVETCNNGLEHEYPLFHYGIRICSDGTTSFDQPDNQGLFDNEGKCGQTAASNVFHMYCKMIASPNYCGTHLNDAMPGVKPSTLDQGLDKLFNEDPNMCPTGFWDETNYKYQSDFILGIEFKLNSVPRNGNMVTRQLSNGKKRKKSPVMLLIKSPDSKKGLHWVTAVDIERSGSSCHMILNTWGDQYRVPCKKVAQWSKNVGKSYGLVLSKYTVIDFHTY